MFLEIKQTKTNGENLFEISENNNTLYVAKAPWMSISAPFSIENIRKLTMLNIYDETVFTSNYKLIDNTFEEAIPFKYLITGQQRYYQFDVIGENDIKGTFFTLQNGFLDTKFCIACNDKILFGYTINKGKISVISIYDGDRQIAQITKPLSTLDNLDLYFLHIADDYRHLSAVLSFFTIYFDYRFYNNSGQSVKDKTEVSWSYSYNKNNKFYNPNWIKETFGDPENQRVNQLLESHRAKAVAKMKKNSKTVLLVFLIGVPLILGIVLFLLWKYNLL